MKFKDVGSSGVTPIKQFMLNRLVGRELGVLSLRKLPVRQVNLIDLTAGSGIPQVAFDQQLAIGETPETKAFAKGCSPGIFLSHASAWAQNGARLPLSLTMIEKQDTTFQLLAGNTEDYLDNQPAWRHGTSDHAWDYAPSDWEGNAVSVNLYEIDARDWCARQRFGARESLFFCNDPNHIADWALPPAFLHNCPRFTTSLSTLGCNVGGLKRMRLEERMKWFDIVQQICTSIVREWHDAALLSVNNNSQWAYLITVPAVWRECITADCLKAASTTTDKISKPPTIAWCKAEPARFKELQNYLFFTQEEIKNGMG
jgi:hypothetical protein